MLNLDDLSVSELQAYCDGIREVAEIIVSQNTVRNSIVRVRARYTEAQNIIASRLEEMTLKPRRFTG